MTARSFDNPPLSAFVDIVHFPPLLPTVAVFPLLCAGLLRAATPPPATWQEHWFEHNQALDRVYYDSLVALYFDDGFTSAETTAARNWMVPYARALWSYVLKTYGEFGSEGRLYCIFHDGRYSGGHPSTYFDASHDFRNVSDVGPGGWTSPSYDIFTHEVGHVVEGANNNILGSPAFGIWGDSKWAEIFIYDCYVGMGMTSDALRVYDNFLDNTDSFPREGSHWFRDWYYPIWRDYGRTKVLVRFFRLLSQNFPTVEADNGQGPIRRYARDLNWGEYVYFMSAAAGTDLRKQARAAFGWPDERNAQYLAARAEFADIDPAKVHKTVFGRMTVKDLGARYRLFFKIRDKDGIKNVTVRAGKKVRAKKRGKKYVVTTKGKPLAAKVVVVDGGGDRAKKRYSIE